MGATYHLHRLILSRNSYFRLLIVVLMLLFTGFHWQFVCAELFSVND
ncbi:hypothetical protein HanPSC8_Chr08g0316011 [Helianthus annuus]|nr:hypothetical protein HanPSC8_Chr08g0316011 [Helianthus annuus]